MPQPSTAVVIDFLHGFCSDGTADRPRRSTTGEPLNAFYASLASAAAAGFALGACHNSVHSSLSETDADTKRLEAHIDTIAENALRLGPVAGLSIAVLRGDGPVIAKGYGYADIDARIPATAATVYDIASVSKLFTALAILKLVDEGKLDLDDNLQTLLPEFPDPDQGHRITLRQLLNHTSGLSDYLAADYVRFFHAHTPPGPLQPSFVLDYLKGRALDSNPGSEWQYSNSGFYLAGMILERVAGRPWVDFVHDEIAHPLGMDATRSCDAIRPDGRTRGYLSTESGFAPNAIYAEPGVQGDGGLCSTVLDLARLPAALRQYSVIPEHRLTEMLQPTMLDGGVSVDYGLGVRLGELVGRPLWGHTGSVFTTYASTLAHYPQEDVTIAVLVNTAETSADALVIEGRVASEVFNLGVIRSAAIEIAGSASVYVGDYVGDRDDDIAKIQDGEVPNTRSHSRIIEDGDGIARIVMPVTAERPPLELIPLGNHTFAREDWPLDRFVFAVEDGRARGYSEYYNGIFATFNRRVDR